MRKIFFITICILFYSCKQNNAPRLEKEMIEKIQNSKYHLFKGVTIEARSKRQNVFIAPFMKKEENGVEYLLPNFKYYGCAEPTLECLKENTNKKFDIKPFSYQYKKQNIPYSFVNDYTSKIFEEYEKINIPKIVSKESIGDCIIFFINNNYLVYASDINNINNEKWISRLIDENKIDPNWYLIKK